MTNLWSEFSKTIRGDVHRDEATRRLYATDASMYRKVPEAVILPGDEEDIARTVIFAGDHGKHIIPRAAGTSLAGQCVGDGIVLDVSRYLTKILEVNPDERWVRVQPGVIRDELNHEIKSTGLQFGPDTSTSNRCMLGGMVGNNSCGSSSIVYGSTRDHLLALSTVLSDGSQATFQALDESAYEHKLQSNTKEGYLYRQIDGALRNPDLQHEIESRFPHPDIHRRNTGYAIDVLSSSRPFHTGGPPFNFCTLLAGSEGTLAVTTEIILNLVPLPPPEFVLICVHCHTIRSAMEAATVAMTHGPTACELMDKFILDCTKDNLGQRKNRFFLEGDPAAILIVEFRSTDPASALDQAEKCITSLKSQGLGYAFPVIDKKDAAKVWSLRKAGLGLLFNMPGDAKPVASVEDTAVRLEDLPDYIDEFAEMLKRYDQKTVYYAHAGAGEIHLRPILDLRQKKDRSDLRAISNETVQLVKKYRGSWSGEHGDGRARAEFIPELYGNTIYDVFRKIKETWDPQGILNPGKIVHAGPMDSDLRYEEGQPVHDLATLYDFSETGGIQRLVEKCNGAGVCRKKAFAGGTMCPSYQATRDEKDSTRGRANLLREILSQNRQPNPFDDKSLYDVLDLCLSCKACTSECPSGVNMTMLKSEFLYQYYQSHRRPLRNRVFSYLPWIHEKMYPVRRLHNLAVSPPFSGLAKAALGIAPRRSLPRMASLSFARWYRSNYPTLKPDNPIAQVLLFNDEFTNYLEPHVGYAAVKLLAKLGIDVLLLENVESGRAAMSKGHLRRARKLAETNLDILKGQDERLPILGLEPSAILGLRDEYPVLVAPGWRNLASEVAGRVLLLDEYLYDLMNGDQLSGIKWSGQENKIVIHGHCHQKSLSDAGKAAAILSLIPNADVHLLSTGCCGMAGSFGYEKEHYELSLAIGEITLLPQVRNLNAEDIIVADGTSCRHQILPTRSTPGRGAPCTYRQFAGEYAFLTSSLKPLLNSFSESNSRL
jgi:FAD/FMN-containing dehydrogenase/Fe-S oxidoreductase